MDMDSSILRRILTQHTNNSNSNDYSEESKTVRGVGWHSKPSWDIYWADQKNNLLKFHLPKRVVSIDHELNHIVSLSFPDTCISKFAVDVVVNPTTEDYTSISGVSKVVHEEAGPNLKDACLCLPKLEFGQAVITLGFKLPAQYVIHTNGPGEGQLQWPEMLKSCYKMSLELMVSKGLRTIAFPCISAGGKKVDPEKAAEIALTTVRQFLEMNKDKVDRIIFSLHNDQSIYIYRRYMQVYFPCYMT